MQSCNRTSKYFRMNCPAPLSFSQKKIHHLIASYIIDQNYLNMKSSLINIYHKSHTPVLTMNWFSWGSIEFEITIDKMWTIALCNDVQTCNEFSITVHCQRWSLKNKITDFFPVFSAFSDLISKFDVFKHVWLFIVIELLKFSNNWTFINSRRRTIIDVVFTSKEINIYCNKQFNYVAAFLSQNNH